MDSFDNVRGERADEKNNRYQIHIKQLLARNFVHGAGCRMRGHRESGKRLGGGGGEDIKNEIRGTVVKRRRS